MFPTKLNNALIQTNKMQQRLSYIDAGIDSWEQLLKMITKDAVEKVESINLHSNKLSKIEPAIKSFKALQQLDLSSNDIVDLSGIVGVSSISHLNLSANKIRTLSAIGQLVNLQYLNLSCNRIESISAISNLKHLRFLDLHANQIRTNAEIIHLKKLTKLKELVLNDDNRDSGMNPICKQAGYEKEVWKILPQLLILNGLDKLGNITPTMYKHPDLEMYAALLSCEKKQVMPIENQKDLDEALTFDVDIRIKELEKSLAAHAEQGCPNSDYGSRVQKVESQIAQLLNGSEYHRIQNQGYDALVTALEAERKKSKEKELQYSQKIKILTNQHQDVKKENAFLIEKLRIQEATLFKANLKLEDYENMKLSSKELRKQLSEMSKQKASMDEKYRKTQNQYPEIKSANDLLVKELETSSLNLKRLGNEFNELRKNHDTSTIKIQELNDLLRRCEVEKTRVTESTALEITEWKGKCAEAIKEKGIIFDALTHSNDEISSLKTSLETKESQYLNEIKQLKA